MKRIALAAVCLTAACDSDPLASPPENLASSYQLTTRLTVPADAALPPPAYDIAVSLRGLRTEPGKTVFDLLEKAGVPLLADIKDALPGVLEDKLEGWVGGAIRDNLDLTRLDPVIVLLDTALADIDLESTLETTPAIHRVDALRFASLGAGARFDISAVHSPLLTKPVVLTSAGLDLVVRDHAFSLPIGEYAWTAIDQAIVGEYGVDLRTILIESVDCAAVAVEVASKDVLGQEVGHEDDLRELCEDGVALAADAVEDQVKGIVWEAVRFEHGQAVVVDGDTDGIGESLSGGVWKAKIDAGQGARQVPGVFTGVVVE
jgi:hypothetical protein